MVTRRVGVASAGKAKVAKLRELTWVMKDDLERCQTEQDQTWMRQLFELLSSPQVDQRHYDILVYALGLDDSGMGPRPIATLRREWFLNSEEDVQHRIDESLRFLYGLKLPEEVHYSWLR